MNTNKMIKKKKQLINSDKVKNNLIKKSLLESKDSKFIENTELTIDFFNSHFYKNIGRCIESKSASSQFQNWHSLGRIVFESQNIVHSDYHKNFQLDDDEDKILPATVDFPKKLELKQFCLKSDLVKNINIDKFSSLLKELYSIICQYVDLYYPEASYTQWENIKFIYSLHCINHIIKIRSTIIENNDYIYESKDENCIYRDQGFTRPKVLILVPFKNSAYRVVKHMMSFIGGNIINKKRFDKEFGSENQGNWHIKKKEKPKDFQEIFSGDINEDFIIGLTITKKSLKLFSDIFESDIIIGSPLGVRYSIEAMSSQRETDWLSSIEILIVDQADIFQMQNWEHILIIMESLNQPLQDINNLYSDVTRIHLWCLEGNSKFYRQTLVFASTLTDLNRTLVLQGKNYAGRIQVLNFIPKGSIMGVIVKAELFLQRVTNDENDFNPDAHFTHFIQHVLPQLRLNQHGHTLIYVPDYCDYIRIIKYMKEDGGTTIATLNEYMVDEVDKIAKAKSLFFDGKRQYIIYTERLHFYKRYKIKGIHHILFYGLPTYPHYFSELCNLMAPEYQNPKGAPLFGLNTITALYQPIEVTKLVGILGTEQAALIARSDKAVHMSTIGS